MIENPDRVERIIPENPEKHPAYLYEWYIADTGKSYIGYRSQPYDGTYIHSSKCPIFARDLAKAKNIIFKILQYGSAIDMATQERKMLKDMNAKNNPKYYNRSNGGGKYVIDPFEKSIELYHKIKNGELNEYIRNVPITELLNYNRMQVRFADDSIHEKNIKDRIDDNMGSQDYINENYLCHALEHYEDEDKHSLFNGSHSRKGISKSIVGETAYVPVMMIPKHIWSNYTKFDLKSSGNLLNGKPKSFLKNTDDLDLVKIILDMKHNFPNIQIDSVVVKEYLKNEYYMTNSQITGIIKKVKKELHKNTNSLMGKVWIQWQTPSRKDQLQAKLDELRDKNTFTMAMSSGKFDWNKIIACVMANYGKKKNFILYIHHPLPNGNIDYETTWTQEKYPMHHPEFKMIFDALGVNIKVECLPTLESDGSNKE
jgi:hypothetical protein